MPRIVRLDPHHLASAVDAVRAAQGATDANWNEIPIEGIAECLSSVVGASKLLHFANPKVFPIWDSKAERFRLCANPSQYHMGQVRNYKAYASEVHRIRQTHGFAEFYAGFNQAFAERLNRLTISPYRLTEVRAVESAMFELSERVQ